MEAMNRVAPEIVEQQQSTAAKRAPCCANLPKLRFTSAESEEIAAKLKALAHPVRLQIVSLLAKYEGAVCVCDIESYFHLKQPTISHHLKTLRNVGLIDCERRGLWAYYFAQKEALEPLRYLFGTLAKES